AKFPDLHAGALAYACRCLIPLVQVPPRGVWGKTLQVTSTPIESWVGPSVVSSPPSIDVAVLRYLAAFGPASVADVMAWCRLTGLGEVVDRLRPRLRAFTDARGRELFDVDDGPRPDPDTPAPVRFLPEYDNVLLSHANRSRFGVGALARANVTFKGSVLVDGTVQAAWHVEHDKKSRRVALVVEHLPLGGGALGDVEAEAWAAVRFLHAGAAEHEVRMVAAA
ncbi:MAG: hypothetical protein QOF60_1528, partial [Actinomycetota bacterium]|nr:hypothetical protein [Actinomycetota bacterium]